MSQILCISLKLLNLLNHFLENYIADRSASVVGSFILLCSVLVRARQGRLYREGDIFLLECLIQWVLGINSHSFEQKVPTLTVFPFAYIHCSTWNLV